MQVFPRSFNKLPVLGAVVGIVLPTAVVAAIWYWFSPRFTQVGYSPKQPVPYSHRLHAGELGIDCRYCHVNVERGPLATVPPTQTCMSCHSVIKTASARLEPVRESWKTGGAVEWVRVHRLPDHAYFDHGAHVAAGVGCAECHGRIDQMDVVRQVEPLSMGWCLDCHRDPGPRLRPPAEVTNMAWTPPPGAGVQPARAIRPPENCSGCHR